MSQNKTILAHLRAYGSITPKVAYDKYGCLRLAARISNLREDGHIIYTDIVEYKTKDGQHKHYARYRLEEERDTHHEDRPD